MNGKQKKFAELYAASPNATEAAKGAGYSERTARSQGQRLLTNVDIMQYIQSLQEKAAAERILSLSRVKAFWSDIMQDETQKTADRLKASELLAKSAGAFLNSATQRPEEQLSNNAVDDVIIYMPQIESCEYHTLKKEPPYC